MKTIRLKHDTSVRFGRGTVLEVSDAEASRLIAFGNAELIAEKAVKAPAETAEKPKKKTTRKK